MNFKSYLVTKLVALSSGTFVKLTEAQKTNRYNMYIQQDEHQVITRKTYFKPGEKVLLNDPGRALLQSVALEKKVEKTK